MMSSARPTVVLGLALSLLLLCGARALPGANATQPVTQPAAAPTSAPAATQPAGPLTAEQAEAAARQAIQAQLAN